MEEIETVDVAEDINESEGSDKDYDLYDNDLYSFIEEQTEREDSDIVEHYSELRPTEQHDLYE